jgi:hypothetical protein
VSTLAQYLSEDAQSGQFETCRRARSWVGRSVGAMPMLVSSLHTDGDAAAMAVKLISSGHRSVQNRPLLQYQPLGNELR